MRRIHTLLQESVAEGMKSLFAADINPTDVQIQETRREFTGDYTVVVFPLVRASRKNPQETGEALGKYLTANLHDVESWELVKGFLNLKLTDSFWHNYLQRLSALPDERLNTEDGTLNTGYWEKAPEPRRMIVEYSSPNTNKPLHLGHIRNNLLGYSVAELLAARGHDVLKANLINDRGIHICKSMLAWMKWGEGETPETAGLKGDHLVGKYYVLFDKQYKKEIEALKLEGKTEEQAEKEAPLILEAQQMLRQWEAGDPTVRHTWETMNSWVYTGFHQTYKSLGVAFDRFYYESNTYLLGKDIVQEGLESNAFYKKDDGSVWIDLTDEGLDEKLVLRGDGTSVYITQDLGTAQQRVDETGMEEMIYVVGNEQDYHFKVLSLIFKKMGRPWWNRLMHLSYGMVDLPSGKMKSREGTVVDADDLIAEMISTAQEATAGSAKILELPEDERTDLYRKIGMAALKFFILKVDPKKRMLFNPQESIDLHGFTGPFIQYSYARIRSILRKAADSGLHMVEESTGEGITIHPEEKELLRLLYKKDMVLAEAERDLSPAVLANFAYELAKTFNQFYDKHSVLNEPEKKVQMFRLSLSIATARCIKESLKLLGIEVPERM